MPKHRRLSNVERVARMKELLTDIREKAEKALQGFSDPITVGACSADIELAIHEVMDMFEEIK